MCRARQTVFSDARKPPGMSQPQASRREFLQGKAAVQAIEALGAGPASNSPPLATPEASYLVHFSRTAMACQFEIVLNAGQYAEGAQAALAGLELVDELDAQLSVYRPTSEVSQLNQTAADRPTVVERRLFELLQLAVATHTATRGAFDITAGPLSRVWGFTQRAGGVPDAATLASARSSVGSQWLTLDADTQSVTFRRAATQINLGAIGKGYALDRVAECLLNYGVNDFLLHGGNSSVLARGDHGLAPACAGWLVGVRNPLRPERRLGQLALVDQALATSGSGTQFFLHEGRRYGHILDPRTGWPAEGVLSSTVLAPTAALADALSTAFYVLGPTAAADYCQQHPEIGCVLVCPGERAGSIQINTHGLRDGQWRLLEN
jgi:thiamine biosynthesis lipoprotein